MNKPERIQLRGTSDNVEVFYENGSVVVRRIVSRARLRRAVDDMRKHMPKPKKGADVVRELHRLRLRRGVER